MREYLKRHGIRIFLSLSILAFFLVHVANWHNWTLIDRFERIAYDVRLLLTLPGGVDERIVIVEIDEESLAAEGQWPWPRDRIAQMVDQLFDHYGAELVAFDVVLAEPEETTALALLEELARDEPGRREHFESLRQRYDRDRAFVESLHGRDVVLGLFFTDVASTAGQLPEPLFPSGSFAGATSTSRGRTATRPIFPPCRRRRWRPGTSCHGTDVDGLIRRVPMLFEYDGDYYEAFSLAIARHMLGDKDVVPGYPSQSRAGEAYSPLEWLEVGDAVIPVDAEATALVPYRGPKGSFPYVSATEVISGAAPKATIEGRVVLIGATAEGLQDLRATPVQADYPGVEVHANLVAGILDGTIKENPGYTLGAEFILVLICGLLMALLVPVLSPVWAGAMTLTLLGAVMGLNLYVWHEGNFVFPFAASVLTILTLFLFNMWYAYFFEARGKRRIEGMFGEYIPPELVEEMSRIRSRSPWRARTGS